MAEIPKEIRPRMAFDRARQFVDTMNELIAAHKLDGVDAEEAENVVAVVDQINSLVEMHLAREYVRYRRSLLKSERGKK